MKKSTPVLWLLLSSVLLITQSCIDNKYSLDNLPDKLLVAGDSIVLPLGYADTLTLKKFMQDQSIDNLQISNDSLIISQSGAIDLTLPTNDLNIASTSVNSPTVITKPSGSTIPDNTWVPTNDPRVPAISGNIPGLSITPSNSAVVKRIDNVIFKAGATLTININLSGTVFDKNVNLLLDIPTGLVLQKGGNNITLTNGKYAIAIAPGTTNISETFSIASLNNSESIQFSYSIDFNNANIKYLSSTSDKSFKLSVNASNLMVDKFYGLIDYSGSKSGISTDISSLYTDLSKKQSDVISLYSPLLILNTQSNVGIPFNTTLAVSAKKGGTPISFDSNTQTSTQIKVLPPATINETKTNHYEIDNNQIGFSNIIKARPDIINVNFNYASDLTANSHFISANSFGKVNYQFKIPMAFGSDFSLSYSDTITDVFDKDINEYLFSTGEVKMTGTVVSTLPLNATFKVNILTEGKTLIPITSQGEIKAYNGTSKESPITIIIKASDIAGKSPKDLIGTFSIKGSSTSGVEGKVIKSTDFVLIKNLKIVKAGGISISTK